MSVFYLTKLEKDVLYRKYIKQGMLPHEANKRIKGNSEHLRNLVLKLQKKGLEEKDINVEFKEAFSRMVESYR